MRQFLNEIRNNPALLEKVLKAQREKDRKELRQLLAAAAAALQERVEKEKR